MNTAEDSSSLELPQDQLNCASDSETGEWCNRVLSQNAQQQEFHQFQEEVDNESR